MSTRHLAPAARREVASPEDAASAAAHADLKARLIDTFNHELRTPMTTLICHAELLTAVEGLPPAAQGSLAAIGRAATTLRKSLTMISEMLSTEPPMTLAHVPVDVAALVRRLVDTLGWRPHPRGVTVRLTESSDLTVPADVTLLRRAVLELLDNAQIHAPAGTQVDVRVTREGGHGSITVADRGPGMSAVDRATYMRTADDGGHLLQTGPRLGLAIAGATAAAHGGELVLEDSPGGGLTATLRVAVPAEESRAVGGARD